jgi:protein ImuB
MKRVMCVYLPSWPLQRLGHESPALRQQAVVVVDSHGARGAKVVLASRLALRAGARPGMPLAEAQALVPRLAVHEHDPEADREGLLLLAKAAECYSPVVAVEEGPEPQGLLLDVAGVAGCFGGEDRLLARAAGEYAEQGWTVRLALADTAGAAWGFSRYSDSPYLAPPGATEALFKPLPSAALRLPAETLALLAQLGLDRVGDLLGLARADLAARFGPLLLRRLDQALGQMREVVVLPGADPELQAGQAFDYPIERFDRLWDVIDQLLEEIHRALSRRNLGARQLECRLDHETAAVTTAEVGLYRPSSSPHYLGTLLRARLEQVQLTEPISAVLLAVTLAEKLPEMQRVLFERGGHDEAGLAALIDRLSNLLGRQAVTRPCCVADAQPEHAFRFDSVFTFSARGAGSAAHAADAKRKQEIAESSLLVPRPLTLWPTPVPVEVLTVFPDGPPVRFAWQGTEWRVAHWWGPERIETGWWRGEDVQRDYYVVTTQTGSRFWLFRRRGADDWFLHGCFD